MSCPICNMPSAFNASRLDPRCGPCHNFRLIGFYGRYSVIIKHDFTEWLKATRAEIVAADNLGAYYRWLSALESSSVLREL